MVDYKYWVDHVQKFSNDFGERLEIKHCELNVLHNSSSNIPHIIFGIIGIPIQYLDILNVHCNLILCNKNLFKTIGKPELENLDRQAFEIPNYNSDPEEFKRQYLENSLSIKLPLDVRRQRIAGLLRDLITYFAIYHEIGHARQNEYTFLKELSSEQKDDENWDLQAAEVDADIFSINWLWKSVFYNFHQFEPSETVSTKKELIEVCLYSTFLFFYLSNNTKSLYDPFSKYPHPIVRFSIISKFLQDIVERNELYQKQDFNQIVESVLREFNQTLIYHFNCTNTQDYFSKFFAPEVYQARLKLAEYLKINPVLNVNRSEAGI